MTDNRANKKTSRRIQSTTGSKDNEDWPPLTQASRSSSPTQEPGDNNDDATLHSILREIKDFRRDNTQQLTEIRQELNRTNSRLEEAENRIDEAETTLQAMATLMNRMIHRQANMEAKLTDQEGRARRDNLRIYGIPEKEEGDQMCIFLEKMLKDALDIPTDADIRIERAHRVQPAQTVTSQTKPRTIIAKFASYRAKEEVIRKAWQKKVVHYKNTRFFVDHDYPPTVLKKRFEYTEAKKVLREKKIKFQAPYPAKLRVHYEDGIQVYQSAAEATEDMALRGFPVNIVNTPEDRNNRELEIISRWQVIGDRGDAPKTPGGARGGERAPHRGYKEKLQEFKRSTQPNK